MCGISGLLTTRLSGEERHSIVQQMCAAIIHRGPDSAGSRDFDIVSLGMRRLSIIDLSANGAQPMTNEDQTVWIIYNGEIYNFQEERAWLQQKGHVFNSLTDTEVIIHLYEELGPECVHRLRGMFAFAIYDLKKQELFVARDRLGIKPLYYVESPDRFMFASEIKALLASGLLQPELDPAALDHYLTFGCVPAPETMLKGVRALPPGHAIQISKGRAKVYRYWDLPEEGSVQCPDDEVIPRTRSLLEESIRLHQISDAPLGAFLSGGIDSTAVVGAMSRALDRPVRTFSIGFRNAPAQFQELDFARLAADRFHADHTEVIIDGQDVLDEIDRITWYLDQPSADGINSYFVSRAAHQGGLKVALSGLGGDEVFGGYGTYDFIPRWGGVARAWGQLPFSVRSLASRAAGLIGRAKPTGGRRHKLARLRYVDSPLTLYALTRMLLWSEERRQIYTVDARPRLGANGQSDSILEEYIQPGGSLWHMVTQLEIRNYMGHRLLRDTDAMSMAHSLEVRVPLIDHKLVEFVVGLPSGWHKNNGQPKRLLTSALEDIVPKEIVSRPKHGFEFPMAHWMKNELRPVVEDTLSSQSLTRRGLFSTVALQELYRSFLNGHQDYQTVWQFVVLELWMRKYIDADQFPGVKDPISKS
jgi:asparagine synthase (glutamine-hydrolysing)